MRLERNDYCSLFVLFASFLWHSNFFLASAELLVFYCNVYLALVVLCEDEDSHNDPCGDDTHLQYAPQGTRHTAFSCFFLFYASYDTHFLRLQAPGTFEELETH